MFKRTTKQTTTRCCPTTKTTKPTKKVITMEERNRLVAEAAYYKAEARGFQGCNQTQDWLDAEKLIDGQYTVRPC